MSLQIIGMGTAQPEHRMSQPQAVQLAERVCQLSHRQSRMVKTLYKRSGVENRHTVLPHEVAIELSRNGVGHAHNSNNGSPRLGPTTSQRMSFYQDHAPALAVGALRGALAESDVHPGSITHLVTVTCTGFAAPGVDVDLIRQLDLPATTARVQVGFMGCHGAVNGLRVAQAIADSDPNARVALCAVECCSLHYRFAWDDDGFIANALFADGAAALVGVPDSAAGRTAGESTGASQRSLRLAATGSCLIPDSLDDMSWRIGDHGFEMRLSASVPRLIEENLRPWIVDWLKSHDVRLEEVQSWAIHPGGPRILDAVESSLGLSAAETALSRDVLSRYGNMSSPTILFILGQMRSRFRGPCVALGFGPGLVAEAALFR